jgi:hypothetical protein
VVLHLLFPWRILFKPFVGYAFAENPIPAQTDIFFPPGDTHITYPGSEGPLSSMRLEAMRAGIEDYELLRLLAGKNKIAADEIADCCLTSFNEANEDPTHFQRVHRQLLQALSNGETV